MNSALNGARFRLLQPLILGCLWVGLLPIAPTHVQAAGTVTFVNSALTRMQWMSSPGTLIAVPTSVSLVYGLFWGTSPDNLTLVPTLGQSSTNSAGIIVAPTVFLIPGTEEGQTVYLKVAAWPARYGTNWQDASFSTEYGVTDVRQVTLATESGPGTVIWQAAGGSNPGRFYPLIVNAPLTPPAVVSFGYPLPTIVVDEGSAGTVDVNITIFRYGNGSPTMPFSTTVVVGTTNLTAIGGDDFVPTNVSLTFAPGQLSIQLPIKITANPAPEGLEQFGVRLIGGPSFAVYSTETLLVKIREARVSSVSPAAGGMLITIPTTSHQRYALERSLDFLSWAVVPGSENIVGNGSDKQILDTMPDCCGHRFYRTRILP